MSFPKILRMPAATVAAAVVVTACDQPQVINEPAGPAVAESTLPPAPVEIVGDFASVDSWQSYGGGPSPEGLVEGVYTLGPNVGAMSRKSLPVQAGDKFSVDYIVKLIETPKNQKPAQYVVGPMYLDDKGAVLGWGNVEQPLIEESRTAQIVSEAPAGAVLAHLYIAGMWAPEDPAPDGKIAFTAAALRAIK